MHKWSLGTVAFPYSSAGSDPGGQHGRVCSDSVPAQHLRLGPATRGDRAGVTSRTPKPEGPSGNLQPGSADNRQAGLSRSQGQQLSLHTIHLTAKDRGGEGGEPAARQLQIRDAFPRVRRWAEFLRGAGHSLCDPIAA